MKSVPRTPDELKHALAAIFPALPRDFGALGESVLEDAGPTLDSVMREFTLFSTRTIEQVPDRQLRRFAQLVASCLAAGGEVAQAMQAALDEMRTEPAWDRFAQFLAQARAGS